MGKKKSVALMVVFTIVIVALCGLLLFPSIPVGVQIWKPVVSQYDFSTELDGGYYTYYYPEGVIPETEYEDDLKGYQELLDDAQQSGDADKIAKATKDLQNHVDGYEKHGGLYLSTDEQYEIFANGKVAEEYKADFKAAADEVADRYAARGYSEYRVAIVDDYAIRVEIPKTEEYASNVFSMFMLTEELSITLGGETVEELTSGKAISDLIEEFDVGNKNGVAFVKVKFTKDGEAMIEAAKENAKLTASDAETPSGFNIKIGDETLLQQDAYTDAFMDNNREARVLAADKADKKAVELYSIILNSLLHNEFNVAFTAGEVRTFEPVYGDNTTTLLFIALGVIILAMLVLPIVKMGRFGVVSTYTNLSYLVIVGICYKYLLGRVFELTLGGILVFLVGLLLINALQVYIYAAIKKEFALGKTVESAVKTGYKKTIMAIVDIFAVLMLGALAFLIGVGGVYTLAIQSMIVIVTGAFCNLLLARVLNYVFLSASKNKFKYFRFVREEDDDDE